jgi:tryptophan synthase alpha subunit
VIIGSRIVKFIEESPDRPEQIRDRIRRFVSEVRAALEQVGSAGRAK